MRGLEGFLGTWQLAREISHGDGSSARFEGVAEWRAEGAGAVYVERGELVMAQGRFAAERRYLWDRDLRVFFEDGRFFHQVPEAGGTASHWCDPDQYDADYDFSRWPDWQARWQVRGPRKAYVMVSRYRPLGPSKQ